MKKSKAILLALVLVGLSALLLLLVSQRGSSDKTPPLRPPQLEELPSGRASPAALAEEAKAFPSNRRTAENGIEHDPFMTLDFRWSPTLPQSLSATHDGVVVPVLAHGDGRWQIDYPKNGELSALQIVGVLSPTVRFALDEIVANYLRIDLPPLDMATIRLLGAPPGYSWQCAVTPLSDGARVDTRNQAGKTVLVATRDYPLDNLVGCTGRIVMQAANFDVQSAEPVRFLSLRRQRWVAHARCAGFVLEDDILDEISVPSVSSFIVINTNSAVTICNTTDADLTVGLYEREAKPGTDIISVRSVSARSTNKIEGSLRGLTIGPDASYVLRCIDSEGRTQAVPFVTDGLGAASVRIGSESWEAPWIARFSTSIAVTGVWLRFGGEWARVAPELRQTSSWTNAVWMQYSETEFAVTAGEPWDAGYVITSEARIGDLMPMDGRIMEVTWIKDEVVHLQEGALANFVGDLSWDYHIFANNHDGSTAPITIDAGVGSTATVMSHEFRRYHASMRSRLIVRGKANRESREVMDLTEALR